MIRVLASIYNESHGVFKRDVFKVFRVSAGVCAHSTAPHTEQVVLTTDGAKIAKSSNHAHPPPPPPTPPRPPPPPRPRRLWPALAALSALTSLGGVYLYRKINENEDESMTLTKEEPAESPEPASPVSGDALPAHVQYLLVGGGTASFAAMRAIRSARPDAQVLIVAGEGALPYMRPPLSKELWREPGLADAAREPERLAFRQWNGRRRSVTYEPAAFYADTERLRDGAGGAAVARGWRATSLDPARRAVRLATAAGASHELTYDQCLIATGLRARRVAALREAAAAGRSLALRGVRDVQRLAAALDDPAVRTVALVGGGFLATELAVALADRLRDEGKRVVQIIRERAPLEDVLPPYLAEEVARRLEEAGVTLVRGAEVAAAELAGAELRLRLSSGGSVEAQLAVECAGGEPEAALAAGAGLELDAQRGGVLVNAELQARSGVYAAGDVASFYDETLGRRRVEHHDHAVVSGRLAGENMAALAPAKAYAHQSMFWSDLGPRLGYEAIGLIDSELHTFAVFSSDAVGYESIGTMELARGVHADGGADASGHAASTSSPEAEAVAGSEAGAGPEARAEAEAPQRYERGVVLYLQGRRVVGVLLWNLFNRMHIARQVLAQGEFDDMFEVAKLFSLHEED